MSLVPCVDVTWAWQTHCRGQHQNVERNTSNSGCPQSLFYALGFSPGSQCSNQTELGFLLMPSNSIPSDDPLWELQIPPGKPWTPLSAHLLGWGCGPSPTAGVVPMTSAKPGACFQPMQVLEGDQMQPLQGCGNGGPSGYFYAKESGLSFEIWCKNLFPSTWTRDRRGGCGTHLK